MGTVEVRELSVRTRPGALRRMDLAIGSGQTVLVMGDASGSTLLRTVAGLVAPALGSVRVDGEDLTGRAAADVAAYGVRIVTAGWRAFGGLTVRENVLVGARGHADVADDVLALVPLAPGALAGALDEAGERQLAVAVALARRPRVVLVDGLRGGSPAGLHAAGLRGVTSVVAERASFAGRTVVVPDGVDPAAYDRVLAVRNGVLREWQRPAPVADAY
ncbi:MAG TPA: ATP-binding cassette domain-containing protein [Frankiaceae bacterium]|nr:ATP-binding cassette domain-containing protein [Frankiaceae bacterium]